MLNQLESTDFSSKERAHIYRSIQAVVERGQEIDPFTVQDQLKRDGVDNPIGFIFDWIGDDMFAPAGDPRFYVERIVDARQRRELLGAIAVARMSARDPSVELCQICQELRDAIAELGVPIDVDYEERMRQIIAEIRNEYGQEGAMTYRTGYPSIDSRIGGFKRGEMTMVMGRPKTGKTWFLLNVLANMMSDGRRILLTSGEISAKELVAKMICRLAGVNHKRYRTQSMDDVEIEKFSTASSRLAGSGLAIVPRGEAPSIAKVLTRAMDLKPDVVAIDAVYLYSPRSQIEGWEYYVALSRELKNMSTLTDTLVLATHQRNKKGEAAYSDAFWQDSNFMMSLDDRPLGPKSHVTVKGRDGEAFRFKLHVDFDRSFVAEEAEVPYDDDEQGKKRAVEFERTGGGGEAF